MMGRGHSWGTMAALALLWGAAGCGPDTAGRGNFSAGFSADVGADDDGVGTLGDGGFEDESGEGGGTFGDGDDGDGGADDDSDPDGGDGPAADDGGGGALDSLCDYPSTDFDGPRKLLDVEAGSDAMLTFSVQGVPDPSLITQAMLHWEAEDLDHPGQEGDIVVNGGGNIPLPAAGGNDNVETTESVDVTGLLIEGSNRIDFTAGTFSGGTYYFIGAVTLELKVAAAACPEPPPLPTGSYQEMGYLDATYTNRHNWVLRCDGPPYSYTGSSLEHVDEDCDGLFAPDGSRTGTATFAFSNVAPGNYRVEIESFHSASRNPSGALFVVDGIGNRVDQLVDAADAGFETGVWGETFLSGDIDVVLDSADSSASDSVGIVKLVPAP